MNWKFEIIKDWDTIWSVSHHTRWLQHMDASENAHVFFHPALVKAWVETYLPLRKLSPLFVWASCGECIVMLPLVLWCKDWKGAFMRAVVPCGYSDFDYHDPIVSSPNSEGLDELFYDGLLTAVRKEVDVDAVELDGLHRDSLSPQWNCVHEEKCPYIALSSFESLDDYLSTRNKKMRYNLRRQEKKAIEYGELKYECLTSAEWNVVENDLPVLLEYHKLRWPNAYKAPNFHLNLLRHGLDAEVIHFSRILLGSDVASWRLGFFFKNRYYSYMPTLNPKLMDFGVGKLHLLRCIDYAIQNGGYVYDQLRGSEMYKSEWTQDDESVYSYRWDSPSSCSRWKRLMIALKDRIR